MDLKETGSWAPFLSRETEKPYWPELCRRVEAAYETAAVYPPREDLFAAFRLTPPEQVRVVILGQDPYHEPGQAMGLSFSVPEGTALPKSLQNIYKELSADLEQAPPETGDLTAWAKQGVFLLNSVLTVEAHERPSPAHRLSALGQLRHQKGSADRHRRAPAGADLCSSESPVGLPGVLRLPALFQNQRFSLGAGTGPRQLVKDSGTQLAFRCLSV